MDNTSVSVTSTVVAALITALATIIAALIPLLYAEFRVKNISVSESLDSLTASIIEFYSNFSIKTARVFSVKEKSAKVIDDIDFTIGVVFVWQDYGDINLTLPQGRSKLIKMKIGDVIRFGYEDSDYSLALVKIDFVKDELTFQIKKDSQAKRVLSHRVNPFNIRSLTTRFGRLLDVKIWSIMLRLILNALFSETF